MGAEGTFQGGSKGRRALVCTAEQQKAGSKGGPDGHCCLNVSLCKIWGCVSASGSCGCWIWIIGRLKCCLGECSAGVCFWVRCQ